MLAGSPIKWEETRKSRLFRGALGALAPFLREVRPELAQSPDPHHVCVTRRLLMNRSQRGHEQRSLKEQLLKDVVWGRAPVTLHVDEEGDLQKVFFEVYKPQACCRSHL